jgi:hypothetical protein
VAHVGQESVSELSTAQAQEFFAQGFSSENVRISVYSRFE